MEHAKILAHEFMVPESPRAISENSRFSEEFPDNGDRDYDARRLQRAVETVIKWSTPSDLVGGPVDVLVLDRIGGIRWVSREPGCAEKSRIRSRTSRKAPMLEVDSIGGDVGLPVRERRRSPFECNQNFLKILANAAIAICNERRNQTLPPTDEDRAPVI